MKPQVLGAACYKPTKLPPPSTSKQLLTHNNSSNSQINFPKYPTRNKRYPLVSCSLASTTTTSTRANADISHGKLGKKWMEYQGLNNWEGLLDPLDDNLRAEILRYGQFVDAAYRSFDFDPNSPTYATCKHPRNSLMSRSGLDWTGYKATRNLKATCGVQLPRWIGRAPTKSSWIGYVAVCQDKEEIARLGRRDVVIAYRGTATCLEWVENLRATLTPFPSTGGDGHDVTSAAPMVESGFLSLYTSWTDTCPSLQDMVREEIARVIEMYGGDEQPLSFTVTGHSLGAALATLTAYDISSTFGAHSNMVTVMSFGGPRVGNRSFRSQLERSGTRLLRIVNPHDVITRVPGLVIDGEEEEVQVAAGWLRRRVEDTPWVYAEVGRELRLMSSDQESGPNLNRWDVATCHELGTYLNLVSGFVSSTCPFRATAKKMLSGHHKDKLGFR